MDRPRLAAAFTAALIALFPTHPSVEAQTGDHAFEWQEADSMTALLETLEAWLDARTEWSRREAPPRVRFVNEWQAAALQGATASFQRGRLKGLYDPDQSEIVLVLPWDSHDADDVAVLLHELVHHRQAPQHWYCPAAQELSAYKLQESWLAEQGLSAHVNWVAVVLDSGCSPRDIHPD